MSDFNYREYSLSQLENWIHDALSGDATPQEIYSTIREVVSESYYHHKEHLSRAYELLVLLNGCPSPTATPSPVSNVDDGMRPWGHSDLEYLIANPKKDEVTKWSLPVQVDGLSGELYVTLPDDLLDKVGWKEGDMVEYVPKENGFYVMRKVNVE